MRQRLAYQNGSALVEHIIAWPLLLLLTLGTLQMGMLYKAKLTLNHATFQTAREGAVNYGRGKCQGCSATGMSRMEAKLSEAMAPLYMKGAPSIVNYGASLLRAKASQKINTTVEIISPNFDIFKTFGQKLYSLNCKKSKCLENKAKLQIPNDNLNVRSDKVKKIGKGKLALNIQDANLLKIRTSWCYSLEIPVANKILFEITRFKFTAGIKAQKVSCELQAAALSKVHGRKIYMIPISSTSTVQMQTPFIW